MSNMSDKENNMVPFQIQNVIDNMLNPKDNVHLRGNYKFRLEGIRMAIDAAIKKYDNEIFFKTPTVVNNSSNRSSKKKRA